MMTIKPCKGCRHDSKHVICNHPRSRLDDFWEDTRADENGYPWCYEIEVFNTGQNNASVKAGSGKMAENQ
jgi:hypothetical protein